MKDQMLAATLAAIHQDPARAPHADTVIRSILSIRLEQIPQQRAWLPPIGPRMRRPMSFIAACVGVALLTGLLLTGVLTLQPPDDTLPAVGVNATAPASPSPAPSTEPTTEPTPTPAEAVTRDDLLPGVSLTAEEVEPGAFRILSDGHRDLSGAAATELPTTYGEYELTHVIRVLAAGQDGSVWILDRGGFFKLGSGPVHDWSGQPRLNSNDEVEVTRDGTLWRAVPARTLRSFDGDGWTRHRERRIFWGLDLEPDGMVWATWTDTCGADPEGCVPTKVGRYDGRRWSVFDLPRMYDYSGNQFAIGAPDEAWLCCRRNPARHADPGLLQLVGGRLRTTGPSMAELENDMSVLLDASDDGTLWVRRSSRALDRLDDGGWTTFAEADGVPPLGWVEPTFSLRAAPDGSVWITPSVSTGSPDDELKCDGVAHFDGATWTRYLRDTCIFSMDVAPDGALWLQGAKVDIGNINLYTLGDTVEPVQTFVIRPETRGGERS